MYERLYSPTADGKTIHPPLFMTPHEIANTSYLADGMDWGDLEHVVHRGGNFPDQEPEDKEHTLTGKLYGAKTRTHSGFALGQDIENRGYDWDKPGIAVAHSLDRVTTPPLVVDGHHRLAYMLHTRTDDFVPVSHRKPIFGL